MAPEQGVPPVTSPAYRHPEGYLEAFVAIYTEAAHASFLSLNVRAELFPDETGDLVEALNLAAVDTSPSNEPIESNFALGQVKHSQALPIEQP